ncbi:uncharacterized protein LOC124488630 [Hypomesus transpacificus]|uniref:uncharacterized protein LOC124488630 n=1 Tax=Hypomesus transpacificus TaxID=137520 RepID=UPI001F080C44|nr:uncharacterized protein LOC124488630 [Hypomesus transpacificus]XP_046907305.1 uncharacterized protein LOC124488630 [Hypomesus transpacificus]
MHQYQPLVTVKCSPTLQLFLCSVYTPVCVSGRSLPPCKALCEEAKAGCESLMNKFGIDWPSQLECDSFTNESCEHLGVVSIPAQQEPCELITVPMCQNLSYNQTTMPNTLGHKSQSEVTVQIAALEPLVKSVCSAELRFFLCSVHTPQCVEGVAQRPCRSLCERVRQQCQSLLEKPGMSWPHQLTCDSFPEKSCISEDSKTEELTAEEVLAKLNKLGYYVRDQGISLQTARTFLAFMDKDKSGKLDVAEFSKLEHYVSTIKTECIDSYELKNPGFVTKLQMKNALTVRDFILDDETFKALWDRYTTGDGIRYDDFMAILTKLKILKDGFKSNLLSLPCECEVASFQFNRFIQVTLV